MFRALGCERMYVHTHTKVEQHIPTRLACNVGTTVENGATCGVRRAHRNIHGERAVHSKQATSTTTYTEIEKKKNSSLSFHHDTDGSCSSSTPLTCRKRSTAQIQPRCRPPRSLLAPPPRERAARKIPFLLRKGVRVRRSALFLLEQQHSRRLGALTHWNPTKVSAVDLHAAQ